MRKQSLAVLCQKMYSQNSMKQIKKYLKNQTRTYISIFSTNWKKSNKSNITHQFSKYTCRYINSLLVTVSGTVRINLL